MTDSTLADMMHRVIDGNRYMTLGTVEPDGRARLSPVYFTHDGYRVYYWVSAPDAHHSQNVEQRPDVAAVIFDSSALPAGVEAVYLTGTAERVPDGELAEQCAIAFREVGEGAKAFAPDELTGPAPLRLYRAVPAIVEVHIRGSHPTLGTGIDRRLRVTG